MSIPATPTNFWVQTANQQNYLSWDNGVGATSYSVQRSTDGVNFSTLATPSTNSYSDTAVSVGIQYWYQVASVNVDGTSAYTAAQSVIPAPIAEMSLGELRLRAQQRADRVNSQFVTLPEWNFFINQAMFELYDILVTTYEDYFLAPEISFTTNGQDFYYPLPNGTLTFKDLSGNTIVAPPFYKLAGVDLGIQTANNAFVTLNKYNLINRNKYVYPNSASSIYGVFNLQYRIMDNKIRFIPAPSANQVIKLLYVPRLKELLADTDITTIGTSGWLQYVIVRAAKYALDKEESPTQSLDAELAYLKSRIEEAAEGRDEGQPDTVSDIRQGWFGNTNGAGGFGWNGPIGGY